MLSRYSISSSWMIAAIDGSYINCFLEVDLQDTAVDNNRRKQMNRISKSGLSQNHYRLEDALFCFALHPLFVRAVNNGCTL
jgi:hypothetical protein